MVQSIAIEVDDSPLTQPNWPPGRPTASNYRGIGLAEMIDALERGEPHRTSAELAAHVVEAADAIVASAEADRAMMLSMTPERTAPFTPADATRLLNARSA